jgi:hypothetical protein
MKNKIKLALSSALLVSSTLYAGDKEDIAMLKEQIKALQEQMQTLVDETSDMKTGFEYTTADTEKSYSGLGSAASKVYYSKSPLSIGGYGEMYYTNTNKEVGANTDATEVKRFITYFGYKFTDNIILNAEIEYEGGGVTAAGGGDVVGVEFMYLDFLLNNNFNARVGNMLMPIGLINEQHEPTLYTSVQRPTTATLIIPTTWNESGVMAYGDIFEGLEYKVAAVSAIQPDDTAGDKWFRVGRGSSTITNNVGLATVARVDYTGMNGLLLGASVYVDKDITLWDTHVDYKKGGARLYGTYAQTSRSGTTAGTTQVTDSYGGYVNASFDLLSLTSSNMKLPIFAQYENYNPQDKRADGTSGDDTTNLSVGLNFFPHPQIVLKSDYVLSTKKSLTDKITSLSMGFIF